MNSPVLISTRFSVQVGGVPSQSVFYFLGPKKYMFSIPKTEHQNKISGCFHTGSPQTMIRLTSDIGPPHPFMPLSNLTCNEDTSAKFD